MSIISEFKEFAVRGNVIDLAVGVIIGGAFGKITSSLVEDIIMPPIGVLLGKVDFSNKFIALGGGKAFETLEAARQAGALASLDAAKKAGIPLLTYGNFVNVVINFLIVAFCVFLLVKQINRLKGPAPVPPPELPKRDCPRCLTSIDARATRCPHCTSDVPAAA